MKTFITPYYPALADLAAVAERAAAAWPHLDAVLGRAFSDVLAPVRLRWLLTQAAYQGSDISRLAPIDDLWHVRPTTTPNHPNAWRLRPWNNGEISCDCPSYRHGRYAMLIDGIEHRTCKHTLALRIYRRALEDEYHAAKLAGVAVPASFQTITYFRRGRTMIGFENLHWIAKWFDDLHWTAACAGAPAGPEPDPETEWQPNLSPSEHFLWLHSGDICYTLGYQPA